MSKRRIRSGFTLVEMLIVVTVIGLIAATATVRLSAAAQRAKFQHAISRFERVDSRLRKHAFERSKACQMQIDVGTGQLQLAFENHREVTAIDLADAEISRFVAPTRETSSGRVNVDYAPDGTSETFAVELSPHNGEPIWLFFAGLTGQMTHMEEERDVQELLRTLRTGGVDAD